jgi:hypothetical protein
MVIHGHSFNSCNTLSFMLFMVDHVIHGNLFNSRLLVLFFVIYFIHGHLCHVICYQFLSSLKFI